MAKTKIEEKVGAGDSTIPFMFIFLLMIVEDFFFAKSILQITIVVIELQEFFDSTYLWLWIAI